jgi:hypothetical protein
MISPTQRPLPDNTQHSQETNILIAGGIRTPNTSTRAAADPHLRPRGHWNWLIKHIKNKNDYMEKLYVEKPNAYNVSLTGSITGQFCPRCVFNQGFSNPRTRSKESLLVNSELLKEPNELRCVAEMHR